MTRTAADVQAEIDALDDREKFAAATAEADARQLKAFGWTEEALERMIRSSKRLAAWGEQSQALEAERDRLLRAEIDAATPPDVRADAVRLRAAHRSVNGWVLDAEDPWEALETSEAAAWAAVAREAGRG